MRIFGLAMSLMLVAGGCAKTESCKPRTVYVSLALDASAASATQLSIELWLDSDGPFMASVPHVPGRATGVLEVDLPEPYAAGRLLSLAVHATALQGEIGNATFGPVPLAQGCTSISMNIETTGLAGADLGGDLEPSDDLPPPMDMLVIPPDLRPVGQLDCTAATAPASVNLTTEGTIDWIQWGLSSASSVVRKSVGFPSLSSTITAPGQVTTAAVSLSWSDGTPTASSAGTTTGASIGGLECEYLTVHAAADPVTRVLRLYFGGSQATSIAVTLSDGSAPAYNDKSFNAAGGPYAGVYTCTYRTIAAGQTLTAILCGGATGGTVWGQAVTLH